MSVALAPMAVHERLKRGTATIHRQVEETCFFLKLREGTLPLQSYVSYLRSLAIVYSTLERTMNHSKHPLIASIWSQEFARSHLLLSDIESACRAPSQDIDSAITAAL